ncbi:hypothetical protein BN946_scf184844.g30 [Trametes cinnabarina]|uniref:Amino acid permease/ SLC12A domain-containing protein n=1 Tax=Pycnoporus cinnabarinus TaxID=5643 RepID=A0A060S9W8_PYCCI|nr:hypothetical protein BN946_scf184844.g30 [Trametes cinnabarina]
MVFSHMVAPLKSLFARESAGMDLAVQTPVLDDVPLADEKTVPEDDKKGAPHDNLEVSSVREVSDAAALDPDLNPGGLSFEEDLSTVSVGRIIGTGIFSTPSSILGSVGSVGASLVLWVLGSILSACGLFIWLEFGTMFPRSGGEKVYLEAVYKKPKHLSTYIYASYSILLGLTAPGCIVFASNILQAAGHEATRWNTRGIAVGTITFVVLLHGLTPRLGVFIMNGLSVFKILVLLFVVVTGWVVLAGKTAVKDSQANFRNAFAGSSSSSNDYATAMFKVIYSYAGWSNVNYVLNNVKDPIRTLKIAGPLGLGICAVLYLLANVAYFAAATKEEILDSGVTVASLFFSKVFGRKAVQALTVFVALSALGNVFSVTFVLARINQELAKEGLTLPFGNKFWASNWPTGKSPFSGLVLHMIPSIVIMIAPPPNVAYPFILDVQGYPIQVINLAVVIGLFWLRYHKPNAVRPFRVWLIVAFFYLAVVVFLLVAPFIRPANGVGDTPPLPYYLYCLVSIGILVFGTLYWAGWRLVPRWFGYEIVERKDALSDGTVVTVNEYKKFQ